MKNKLILTEYIIKLISKNFNEAYIKESLKYNQISIGNSTVKYAKTIMDFEKSNNSILFLEKNFNWTSCQAKTREEMLAKIPELDFLEETDSQNIITSILNDNVTKLAKVLTNVESDILETLENNLYEYEKEILNALKKIKKELKDRAKKNALYEVTTKLKHSDLNALELIDFLSQIKRTDPVHSVLKSVSDIFYYLGEVEEVALLSSFIEKSRLYEKLVLLNIAFCEDELEFELPISTDSNLYQQIVSDLSCVKHFIFENLTPESIIYNKTKGQYELYNVTPIGTNKDIEINWMELLEGEQTFYHHKDIPFPLSYNDITECGVDINE